MHKNVFIFGILKIFDFYDFVFAKSGGAKLAKEKSVKGKKLFRSRENRMIVGVCGE